MTEKQLKELIREEYHTVKNFMEEKYGFTPELGKVVSNPYASAFTNEAKVGDFEIGDFVHFKSKNKTGMVKKISGNKVTIMTMKGDFTGDISDIKILHQDNVNEGDESDSDMAVDQLETSIKRAQELIAKLRGKGDLEPWVQSLITKAEDYISTVSDYGEVDEYDVENEQDIKEFVQFMREYTPSLNEAEYQGRKVELGKIMQGDVKKFKVYVNNDKGNVVKVNFGQKGMTIKKDNPEARKSFRARMNCDNPGPRWKARYWSCRKW